MNLIELQRSLRQLRLGGMANVLETRLRQAQAEPMAPIDLLSILIADELTRRSDRLLERRRKHAAFRDPDKTLDNFDFAFNPKMNRSLVFDLATCSFIDRREDALFLGPGGTGKSHLAQAIGQAAILQGHKVLYRETHYWNNSVRPAMIVRDGKPIDGTRKQYMESVSTVALLIIDKCEVVKNVELAHGRSGNRASVPLSPPHFLAARETLASQGPCGFCSIRVRD